MPHYPITGMHSHRHPFLGIGYGFGADEEVAPVAPVVSAPISDPTTQTLGSAAPFISGAVSGALVWSLCRAFSVDARKAKQVGFVWGGITVAYGFLSSWLLKQMQELQNTQITVPTNPVE